MNLKLSESETPNAHEADRWTSEKRPSCPAHVSDYLNGICRMILETYSNVHRGSGQYSMITTALFTNAREVILEYLNLDKFRYTAIFCSPRELRLLLSACRGNEYTVIRSSEIGLAIGICVLAIKKSELPRGVPFQTGGDVIKLVSPDSVVWAPAPFRFEAGTPSIVNGILFAAALEYLKAEKQPRFPVISADLPGGGALDQDREYENLYGKELIYKLRSEWIDAEGTIPVTGGRRRKYVNFDNGASTPSFRPVLDTYINMLLQDEDVQKSAVCNSKKTVAAFLNAPEDSYRVIFTRNTTEAVNIAAFELEKEYSMEETVIVTTILEHHSNELPWRYLSGVQIIRLDANCSGFIDTSYLELLLKEYNINKLHGKKRIRLVAVCGASNVLGTIQDLSGLSSTAHAYGARIFVDAAQLIAHRRISMDEHKIDYLAFSGHKLYAPFGSGALVVRKDVLKSRGKELDAIIDSGEENAAGIAAMAKAMSLLSAVGIDNVKAEEQHLHKMILRGLSEIPGIHVYGIRGPDSTLLSDKSGVISFSFKGVPHNIAARELAEEGGIGVRTGCFCAHLITKQLMEIKPLRASAADLITTIFPNFPSSVLPGIVRVSIGLENTEEDVRHLLKTIRSISEGRRSPFERFCASIYNGKPFLRTTETGYKLNEYIENKKSKIFTH